MFGLLSLFVLWAANTWLPEDTFGLPCKAVFIVLGSDNEPHPGRYSRVAPNKITTGIMTPEPKRPVPVFIRRQRFPDSSKNIIGIL